MHLNENFKEDAAHLGKTISQGNLEEWLEKQIRIQLASTLNPSKLEIKREFLVRRNTGKLKKYFLL